MQSALDDILRMIFNEIFKFLSDIRILFYASSRVLKKYIKRAFIQGRVDQSDNFFSLIQTSQRHCDINFIMIG